MRKAILLAMAAAIVAMFAMPGSASAAWKKHHVALDPGVNVTLQITGTDLFFETEVGGVTCIKTISEAVFEGGTTTGIVKTFESELNAETPTITSNCQGRGLIAQCDVHEAKADNLPWVIHTHGLKEPGRATVSVTTGTITNTLTGFFCPHTLSLTPGEVHFQTTEINTTSTATLESGTTLLKTDGDLGNNINTTVSGTIHVLGTITYGV